MGTPQERWREMHQSGLFSTMPYIRSSPQGGTQATFRISSSERFLKSSCSIEMNHWGVARKMVGLWLRQSCG